MNWVFGIGLILVFVFAHETGHFVVGRLVGVEFTEYSIGMGPRLVGWQHNGVDYRLSLLPIGGYVRQATIDGKPCFENLPKWRALLFVWAGVMVNFGLAFLCYFLLNWLYAGESLWGSLQTTVSDFWSLGRAIPSVMYDLIIHPVANSGVTPPTETVTMASKAVAGWHWERLAYFAFLVNMGLAIVNALPVMPLDGGQAMHILLRSKRAWMIRLRQTFIVLGVAWFTVFIGSNVVAPLYRQLQHWLVVNGYWSLGLPLLLPALAATVVLAFLVNQRAQHEATRETLHPSTARVFRQSGPRA
jgi:membrane-associated protease RseP (regulator of RpoE activity)